jgi:glycosyltransferase involved in cell wall biosynthesis
VSPLRIWLICVGEPLPIDPGGERLLRVGVLAQTLLERGHDVTWWTSTFDHSHKRHRFPQDTTVAIGPNYRLTLLHGSGYRTNVSFRRMIDHWLVARRFRKSSVSQAAPDLIFVATPTVELAAAATQFGRLHGVPVIVDVRDLWPDVILDALPPALRGLGHIPLWPLQRQSRKALRSATGITAVSPSYLRWGLRGAGRAEGPHDRVIPLGYPEAPGGAPTRDEASALLRALGVDPAKRLIWFIGTFGHYYDLATVIKAARVLRDQGRGDLQFVLSGAGHRDAEWRAQAAGLDNVTFTGWVTANQIAAFQYSAWAGLAAYAGNAPQSLPNKLFEYMAGGLPVLSSLGEDARNLLQQHDCGMSYQAGNAEDLVRVVQALRADDEHHARMAKNGREAFEGHYSATRVYATLADFLEQNARPGSIAAGRPG